jgi:hypothetical protein
MSNRDLSFVFASAMLPMTATAHSAQLDTATLTEINGRYRELIEAENRHDLAAVRQMVRQSPDTLFVAKTATPAEGNWAAFWGADVVMQHFAELYAGTFVMAPHCDRVKTVGLTGDVADLCAARYLSLLRRPDRDAEAIPDDRHVGQNPRWLEDGDRRRASDSAGKQTLKP